MQIELNGEKYLISEWRGKDVIDFAPRASVMGGSIIHNELGLYQPLLQTDWQHGFGFQWDIDEAGYLRTEGRVDTRHDGIAMLWSVDNESDTANARKDGFVNFDGDIYAWGVGGGGISGLRKSTDGGATWADVAQAGGGDYGTVNFALETGTYLFVCPDGARIEKISTADAVTAAGVDGNATDFKWLEIHAGYIFAGKDGTNVVHYGSAEDLSDLEGSTSSDTAEIYVGHAAFPTLGAISWAGHLYIAKADGLYQLGDDLQTAKRVLRFAPSSNNFRFLVEWNGLLVFPIRDRLLQWNGRNINDLTPPKITDSFPYTTYGRFDNGLELQSWLVCTARTNESTYEEHILAWDGVGWHKLAEPVTNGSDSITAMGYDHDNNYLWYHLDATADKTYYIQLQDNSEFPFADFPTTGTHSLITSRIGAGFHWVPKSTHALILQTANLSSTEYISVYYQLDGDGTWVLWEDVKRNGTIRLENPGGDHTVEYKYIQLRFDLVSGTAAQTPILEAWTLKLILRPEESYGYTFDINVETDLIQGMKVDKRSSLEIKEDLREARASTEPIELVTVFGEKVMGYLTAINENAIEQKPKDSGGAPDVDMIIRCSFVEIPELND